MTLVSGPLTRYTQTPSEVEEAHIWATKVRPDGDGLMLTEMTPVEVTAGYFEEDLAPGPGVINLISGGDIINRIDVIVADSGTQSLAAAHEAALVADDATVRELERLAAQFADDVEVARQAAATAGKSAYEIARDNGFTGTETEWLDSLQGEQGLPGAIDTVDGSINAMVQNAMADAATGKASINHEHPSDDIHDATDSIGHTGAANLVVKTNERGQITVPTNSIATPTDVVNRGWVDQVEEKIQPLVDERTRLIPAGTNWDTLREPGPYRRRYDTTADTNDPTDLAGHLQVLPTGHSSGMVGHLFAASGDGGIYYRAQNTVGGWSTWKDLTQGGGPQFEHDIIPGTDWDTLTEVGFYRRPQASTTDLNAPYPDGGTESPEGGAIVVPHGTASGGATQIFAASGDGGIVSRSMYGSGVWTPWKRLGSKANSPHAIDEGAARREFLMSDFMDRRGGSIGTGGKAAIALRFDHHTGPWQEKVLPLLQKYNLPWAWALNPRRQGTGTDTMTWEDMQEVALATGGEVFNHGATHGDAQTRAELEDEIVNSLTELRGFLPLLPIDGWMQPGTGGTFGGMQNYETVENYTTEAGRIVMSHHPVVYGHKSGKFKNLNGKPSIGQRHHGIDSTTFAEVKEVIDLAVELAAGVVTLLHPNFVDRAGGGTTSADLEQMFAYLGQLRADGQIEVVSPSALQLCDASHGYRRAILTVPADGALHRQMLGWGSSIAADGVHELHGTLEGPGEITVTVSTRTPASTVTLTTQPGEVWLPISLPVGPDRVDVTITGATGGSLVLRAA